ncbi:MAG: ABC transporter ATP-binding protein [Clostridia bacterium]|nr:ABC transporter ATP-binding protein [Clostridia bacterium]
MARNTYYQDETVRPEINIKQIAKMMKYVYPFRKVMTFVVISMLASVVISLLPPLVIKAVTEKVIPNADYSLMAKLVTALVGIGIADIGVNFIAQYFAGSTGQKIIFNIREDVYSNLMKLPFDFFDSRPAGKIVVRTTNYVDQMATFFSNTLVNFIVCIMRIVVVLVFMLFLNPILTLVVLASLVPLLASLEVIRHFSRKRMRRLTAKISNRSAFLVESIMGAKEIKSFNRKDYNAGIYEDLQNDVCREYIGYVKVSELMTIAFETLWNVGSMCLYAVAIYLINERPDLVTAGTLIAFLSYMSMVFEPFNTLSMVLQQLAEVSSKMELVLEIRDTPSDITEKENAVELKNPQGVIDFEDVTFGYEPDTNVLEHFSLHVKEGSSIALVGPTGSGKTTVINMLTRFYDVKEGSVKIDGTDVRDMTLHSLRSEVGVVMQDPFMFKGKIIENIRYGKIGATDEECIAAAKKIHADKFIEKLPEGYYTEIGERGDGLSAGEKQLISFARIILKDPKIFIFDEATSAVDSETEAIIQKSLDKIIEGRTSFMVAHRLSTIRKADKILYIFNKGIAEQGTHEELIEKKGLYHELVNL